jgi:hypothetical protein
MREKPVTESTLQKYCGFLAAIERTSLPFINEEKDSLSAIAKLHQVSSSAASAIVKLGFVEKGETRNVWHWNRKNKHIPLMAFQLLDYLLHKNKKAQVTPIPGLADISDSLKAISDHLVHIAVQNEKLIKSLTTGQITEIKSGDLFRVDDQELFIAGHIASGVYEAGFQHMMNPRDAACYETSNMMIIEATKDLMNKLRNK